MSHRTQVDRWLKKLAETVGDPNLKLDSEGSLLTTLSELPFSFYFNEPTDTLFIEVYCGDLKDIADQEAILIQALRGNYLWRGTSGGVLGLSGNDLTLAYRLEFPLPDEETPDDFLLELIPRLAGAAQWAEDLTAGN